MRGDGLYFDDTNFARTDFVALEEIATIDSGKSITDLLAGDVRGDGTPEIIIITTSSIDVYNYVGELLDSYHTEDFVPGCGLLADTDKDGKLDIIVGSSNSSGARMMTMNGNGTVLADNSWFQLVQGETKPQIVRNGTIYFTAYSRMRISPKIIGAAPLLGNELEWAETADYLPTLISSSRISGKLAVSTRGLGRDMDMQNFAGEYPVGHEIDARNSITLISPQGATLLEEAVGGPVREGYPARQNSGVTSLLYDFDEDGSEEIVSIVESASSLYQSGTSLRISSAEGEILSELTGPAVSEGSLSCYSDAEGSFIQIWWSNIGEGVVYDEQLRELHRLALPGAFHDSRIRWSGDIDGDGAVETLVSDLHMVHLVNNELEILCSHPARGPVRKIAVVSDVDSTARIIVRANQVSILKPSTRSISSVEIHTTPPGARIQLNELEINSSELPILRNVAAGEHTIDAHFIDRSISEKILLEKGEHAVIHIGTARRGSLPVEMEHGILDLKSLREIASNTEVRDLYLLGVGDLLDSDGLEVVMFNRTFGKFFVLDAGLQVISRFKLDSRLNGHKILGDVNGDGKLDIAAATADDLYRLDVYAADGRIIARMPVTYGYDSLLSPQAGYCGRVYAAFLTGVLLSPRGIYAFDSEKDEIAFFYPKAGFTNGITVTEEFIYANDYTPANGVTIKHENGYVDRDSSAQIHVLTKGGQRAPFCGPFPPQGERAKIKYFLFGKQRDEVYFILNRDPNYNMGTTGIYRIEKDGSFSQLHTGPENADGAVYFVDTPDGLRVVIDWTFSDLLEILDEDFSILKRVRKGPRVFGLPYDIDYDGNIDFARIYDDKFVIEDLEGAVQAKVEIPGRSIINFRIADLDGDGTAGLLLQTLESIHLYGN